MHSKACGRLRERLDVSSRVCTLWSLFHALIAIPRFDRYSTLWSLFHVLITIPRWVFEERVFIDFSTRIMENLRHFVRDDHHNLTRLTLWFKVKHTSSNSTDCWCLLFHNFDPLQGSWSLFSQLFKAIVFNKSCGFSHLRSGNIRQRFEEHLSFTSWRLSI